MTFAHAGIILSYMQWIGEYLMALKGFDYFCSLGYKRQLRQEGEWRHIDELVVGKGF